jgi:hypothetical protein
MTAAGPLLAGCVVPVPARAGVALRAAGTGAELLARFPSRPAAASWPATRATRQKVLSRLLALPFALDNPASQQGRRLGLVTVVNWLESQPGDSWQDRWLGSGAETRGDWRELITAWQAARAGTPSAALPKPAPHAGAGLLVLIGADVIRPGIGWLLRCPSAPRNLAAEMARIRDGKSFAELAALCQSGSTGSYGRLAALGKIAVIVAAKGGTVAGITVGTACSCWRSPPGRAPGRTSIPAARSSTSCCMPGARSAPARRPRCGCSPAAGSRRASS